MKRKLLIFDLDGTIADTIWSIREGVNLALEGHGLRARSYEQIRRAIGNGAYELIRQSLPEELQGNGELASQVLADYDVLYADTCFHIDGCYAGMKEAMSLLSERGYTLAVLSNKQDAYVKKIIAHLFPEGMIDIAMGQTELPRKPDPTVPRMIAERFDATPDECAFIGDSEVDVLTAKNAGMLAVAVSWGYRPRSMLADADIIIDTPQELVSIFD